MESTRNTPQRQAILTYLEEHKTHPTAEEIYTSLKKTISTISLGTIYRNLRLLQDKGTIIEFVAGTATRFDLNTPVHHHFICNHCDAIIDVHEHISVKTPRNLNQSTITITHAQVTYYGLCAVCNH